MANVVFLMAMSLDGFVNDKNGDSSLLYPDFEELNKSEVIKELIQKTGAVIMGRRTFEMAEDPDWYVGNYEFQVPIFVLTEQAPEKQPKEDKNISFTFINDIQAATKKAK
ncbi:MAG TPA: dihydrofolate reductase family protein [Candidatus Saccharimonadales bacterium]|nr:dihydrofolate reductase family protein [Candidatus Saccharimonadales bacterium]